MYTSAKNLTFATLRPKRFDKYSFGEIRKRSVPSPISLEFLWLQDGLPARFTIKCFSTNELLNRCFQFSFSIIAQNFPLPLLPLN